MVLDRNNTNKTDGRFTLDHSNITIHIIVPISPCHPGFQFNLKSQKCECFDNDTVLLFWELFNDKERMLAWFGDVDGKSTVSSCSLFYILGFLPVAL